MEAFYILGFGVFLLAGAAVQAAFRRNIAAEWVIFFLGFFTALAFGAPVMAWLVTHIHEWTQQPPGKLGGGGS